MKRDKEVRFRASTQEVEAIKQKAGEAGYCLSEYLRLLALGYIIGQSTQPIQTK